jgi:hypothetical protein
MLYYYKRQNELPFITSLNRLTISECNDASLLSTIGKVSVDAVNQRFSNDHKAYVAFLDTKPAAFGWVATKKASVGELNHEIVMPAGHRYLWNFRTLEEFRGLGIYPRLLQNIIQAEQDVQCFWIMHAPENKSSESGILKAGFRLASKVSVMKGSGVFVENQNDVPMTGAIETLGFKVSDHEQATCWKCSSPYMANKIGGCCCMASEKSCNQELFAL